MPCDRTRGKGHKLKHSKFHLSKRENLFPVRVIGPDNSLPREVVDSPFLEVFKFLQDTALRIVLEMTLQASRLD